MTFLKNLKIKLIILKLDIAFKKIKRTTLSLEISIIKKKLTTLNYKISTKKRKKKEKLMLRFEKLTIKSKPLSFHLHILASLSLLYHIYDVRREIDGIRKKTLSLFVNFK